MRLLQSLFASLASAIITLAAFTPALAADRTTLVLLVPSNVKSAFSEIISVYEKAHPDVAVQGTFVGSGTIVKEVESNASIDAIVISELTVSPEVLRFIDHPTPIYDTRAVIALSKAAAGGPHAVKIGSAQDLAKPGVRIGMGTSGSAITIWQNQEIEMLDKLYGSGFAAKLRANVQVTKIDASHLAGALEEGLIDATFLFASDIDAKMTKVDLPPNQQITVTFAVAPVKASQHAAQTRDLIAFLGGAEAKGIYRAHGLVVR
jgi:molybdate transport system substrate-binding protein